MHWYRQTQEALYCEKGQTLVEHSLLVGSISGSVAAFRDHPFIVLAALGVLAILLLFWKPKWLVTIVLIAVVLGVGLFVYRWIEHGSL